MAPFSKLAIRRPLAGSTNVLDASQGFEPRGLLAPIVGPMMSGPILKTFNSVLGGLKQKVESGR